MILNKLLISMKKDYTLSSATCAVVYPVSSLISLHLVICTKLTPPPNPMASHSLPAAAKKKRSLFDNDDDFFIMRKPKRKHNTQAPVLHRASTDVLAENVEARTSAEFNMDSHPNLEQVQTRSSDLDETTSSFHTAREESPGIVEVESVAEKAPDNLESPQVLEIESDSSDIMDEMRLFFLSIPAPASVDTRKYEIRYHMREGRKVEKTLSVGAEETFESILGKIYRRARHKETTHGTLYWLEGKSHLQRFFKPSTLRILETVRTPIITILHLSQENNLDAYQDLIPIEVASPQNEVDSSPQQTSEAPGYFVVGLKGSDNKRVDVEVGAATRIHSLLDHYLRVKNLSAEMSKNAHLVFDDEDLDLDGTVADTELEEGFEIEVHLRL